VAKEEGFMRDDSQTSITIVTATSGWQLAVFIEAGEEHDACFIYEPIVAWEIRRQENNMSRPLCDRRVTREAFPIAVNYDAEACSNEWAIRYPDGRYVVLDDRSFADGAECLEYFKTEAAARTKP
jgi:hypothetical protein